MPNIQRCVTGTEAESDALNALINKACALPRIGVHIGRGPHVTMPPTWSGSGATPPGWTKQMEQVWVASVADSVLPLPDSLAALLQGPPAQANLTGPEKAQLNSAIAGRVTVDLDVGGYIPKANGAAQGAGKQNNEKGTP
jgi:hypothetical protein